MRQKRLGTSALKRHKQHLTPISMFSSLLSLGCMASTNTHHWPALIQTIHMKLILDCLARDPSSCCQKKLPLNLYPIGCLQDILVIICCGNPWMTSNKPYSLESIPLILIATPTVSTTVLFVCSDSSLLIHQAMDSGRLHCRDIFQSPFLKRAERLNFTTETTKNNFYKIMISALIFWFCPHVH
ncbi:hypothetical protein TNCV_4745261 [Trichonephila clavipes]|nr:hypothetical protein TNCV_4745261 [Trichonephila clavipes]